MNKAIKTALMICVFVTLLNGCARVRRKIAYTIYPIGWLIQRIGGSIYDTVSIQNGNTLLQNASIREDYQSVLETSKVLFHLGDCEPYLRVYEEDILATDTEEVDLSVMNAVYNFDRYTRVRDNGTVTWEETPYYDSEAFSDIDQDKKDLYIWLDPVSMLAMAGDILSWMEADYPEEADTFVQNYNLLKQDLIELDAEYQQLANGLIQDNRQISFAVISVSFGCWQKAYGIGVYPVMLSKYGVLPNDEQLAAIEERIRSDNISLIVHETNLNEAEEALYQRVKEECGLSEISLSSLSSLSEGEEASGKDYLSLMYDNLQILRELDE